MATAKAQPELVAQYLRLLEARALMEQETTLLNVEELKAARFAVDGHTMQLTGELRGPRAVAGEVGAFALLAPTLANAARLAVAAVARWGVKAALPTARKLAGYTLAHVRRAIARVGKLGKGAAIAAAVAVAAELGLLKRIASKLGDAAGAGVTALASTPGGLGLLLLGALFLLSKRR